MQIRNPYDARPFRTQRTQMSVPSNGTQRHSDRKVVKAFNGLARSIVKQILLKIRLSRSPFLQTGGDFSRGKGYSALPKNQMTLHLFLGE